MLFTSYEFVAFLAIAFVLYYAVPKRAQWTVLLVSSIVFYLFAGVEYMAFIFATSLISWGAALWLQRANDKTAAFLEANKAQMDKEARKAYKASRKKKNFSLLCAALVLGFGILAVLKYTGFAVSNINSILHFFGAQSELSVPDLLLPLGISFYTFRTMGYLIDVYRAKVKAQRNPAKYSFSLHSSRR